MADDDSKGTRKETLADMYRKDKRNKIKYGKWSVCEERKRTKLLDALAVCADRGSNLVASVDCPNLKMIRWMDAAGFCYKDLNNGNYKVWIEENVEKDYNIHYNVTSRKQSNDINITCMSCLDADANTTVVPCLCCVVCEGCSKKLKNTNNANKCINCRRVATHIAEPGGIRKV